MPVSHSGVQLRLAFHPNELILATGGSDATVKLWNMETFSLQSERKMNSAVQGLLFASEVDVLLAASQDTLQLQTMQSVVLEEYSRVRWNRMVDWRLREDTNTLLYGETMDSVISMSGLDLNVRFKGGLRYLNLYRTSGRSPRIWGQGQMSRMHSQRSEWEQPRAMFLRFNLRNW